MRRFALRFSIAAASVLLSNPTLTVADTPAPCPDEVGAVRQALAVLDEGPVAKLIAADVPMVLPSPTAAVDPDPGYADIGDQPAGRLTSPFVEAGYLGGHGGYYEPAREGGRSCCGPLPTGCECDEPCRPLTPRFLRCRDITFGGWLQQGISYAANSPDDQYNGVVTFNDRDSEYQMNQLCFFLERKVDTCGGGLDIGGRIEFIFGTDARFIEAVDGLEANWDQQERFYHAAVPQFYVDVAYNKWTVRTGRFATTIGYETYQAPDNFFYSHSYAKQYGEPFTHLGMLAMYHITDRLTLNAGFHRGWDQFDDTDGLDRLGVLAGINWVGRDRRKAVAFAITSGEQGPGNQTVMYSVVGGLKIGRRISYVIQHDFGQSTGGRQQELRVAEWYGVNQYISYKLNPRWTVGTRIEWFRDRDGVRVRGIGDGNLATGPFRGDFYEIALGLNWKPHRNVILRPEARWDWFNADGGQGANPFDAGDRDEQFMIGCDLIVSF